MSFFKNSIDKWPIRSDNCLKMPILLMYALETFPFKKTPFSWIIWYILTNNKKSEISWCASTKKKFCTFALENFCWCKQVQSKMLLSIRTVYKEKLAIKYIYRMCCGTFELFLKFDWSMADSIGQLLENSNFVDVRATKL